MKTPILAVTLVLFASASAWAQDGGPVDCAAAKYRCDEICQCPVPTLEGDQPCNDLPNGLLSVSYPTASVDVDVMCPTIYVSGAADDETPNNMFYRFELALDNQFTTLTFDSGLVTAAPGTTQYKITPNASYPTPTERGTGYWLRVTDNDDCSVAPAGPYYANPNPWISHFDIADDAANDCLGGTDSDVDADSDSDTGGDGDGDGGGGSSCSTTAAPTSGSPAVLLLFVALGIVAARRKK